MKRSFTTNEFYHIFDRGVDKRKIFLDKRDYVRFMHDLYEFNDINPAKQFSRLKKEENVGSRVSNIASNMASNIVPNTVSNTVSNIASSMGRRRDVLIKIHAFSLVPNHYHLLAEQVKEGGVSLFIRKLHTGYTNAFNLRHKRKGHLFESPFKAIHIEDDIHLGFLICYIHSNPLDLWKPNWKKNKLIDLEIKQALKFLEKYQWSSHLDYSGIKNFPSVISRKFLLEFFDGIGGYNKFFVDWLQQYKKNIKHVKDIIFE